MFLTTKKCDGQGECIKHCPTEAIRFVGDVSFSCICCGACFESCPNHAIFKNKYGGYVVDRAKCNGCGICESVCPVDSIHIEDAVVKGICSRCGLCESVCPNNARIDSSNLNEAKQKKFLNSIKNLSSKIGSGEGSVRIDNMNIPSKEDKSAKRMCVNTNLEECIACGRCSYYCPTGAIRVDIEKEGVCSKCRICNDVCPSGAIDKGVVDSSKCTLCLNCVNNCPNHALSVENFSIKCNNEEENDGTIVSCLNCGLCSEIVDNGSIKHERTSLRYDPSLDEDNYENKEKHLLAIDSCPVSTLKENKDSKLTGLCVSCGMCVKVCDEQNARVFEEIKWDGSVSDDCISCGICVEVCPKEAITLRKGSIYVDLDKCIMCETCGIHCPTDAIPKTTLVKKELDGGFNYIEEDFCIKCGLCKSICPEDAIYTETISNADENLGTINKNLKFVVDEEKCIYCGACKNICPSKAFIFERNFKEATK